MNKEIATKILLEFTKIVDKGFLCYGSALGLIREGGVIEHDLDIDIGIYEQDFNCGIVNKLIKEGFLLGRVFGSASCGLEMAFAKEGIKIDLMIFYRSGNRLWNSLWDNGGRNGLGDMIIHSYKSFDIIEKIIDNKVVRCAGKDYVVQVYGDDWKVPIKNWNWRTDHHCIDNDLKNKIRKIYG